MGSCIIVSKGNEIQLFSNAYLLSCLPLYEVKHILFKRVFGYVKVIPLPFQPCVLRVSSEIPDVKLLDFKVHLIKYLGLIKTLKFDLW